MAVPIRNFIHFAIQHLQSLQYIEQCVVHWHNAQLWKLGTYTTKLSICCDHGNFNITIKIIIKYFLNSKYRKVINTVEPHYPDTRF